jgi:hypothetical protein
MRRAGLAVQFLESTGHQPGAGAATQDVRASPGSPSVGAPGPEKSWRPQPETTRKEKKDQESRCCDFHGSRLTSWYWTLHTRPPAQYFRPATGCPSGVPTSPGSSYLIAATTVRARFLLVRETVCGAKCFRMKGTTASTACIISGKTS